jgi:hypothetical protein
MFGATFPREVYMNHKVLSTKARNRLNITQFALAVIIISGIFFSEYGVAVVMTVFGCLVLMYMFADLDLVANCAKPDNDPNGGTSV